MKRKYHILVVDDENEILAVYRDFFTKRGFSVQLAANGREGLDKLRTQNFDLAIVDIKMPKMDGLTMIKKSLEEGIDTDMIVLTGHGDKDDAVTALNLGVGGWFEKHGIKLAELLAKVKELVEVIPIKDIRKILSAIPDEDSKIKDDKDK